MFIVFVWFGVINGSIKLNQAMTSFLTTIHQPQWPWELGLSPAFLGDAGHPWNEGRDVVGRATTGRPPAWPHADQLET